VRRMRQLSILGKMLVGVIITNLVLALVAFFGYANINQVGDLVQKTSGSEIVKVQQVVFAKSQSALFKGAVAQAVLSEDPAAAQNFLKQASEYDKALKDSLYEVKRVDNDVNEKQNMDSLLGLWDLYAKDGNAVLDLAVQGRTAEAKASFITADQKYKKFMDGVEITVRKHNAELSTLSSRSDQVVTDTRMRFLIFVGVVGLLSVILGIMLARSVSRPLQQMSRLSELIAKGQLSADIKVINSKDELGSLSRAFKLMVTNLSGLLGEIALSSKKVASSSRQLNTGMEQIAKSAEQIATTIQQVAGGSEGQVRSVGEVTSAINEMSAGIQQIAANAFNVSESAGEASKYADFGRETIEKAARQMTSIRETVDNSAEVIRSLGEKSQAIGNIVDLIRNIADQTNLLALNAAIEAARAGEQGKGFAVVAEEVRKLAEQSAAATTDIAALITAVEEETVRAVKSMSVGTKEAAQGTKVVTDAGNAFEDILKAVDLVTKQIEAVSIASREMATGSNQVVKAVENIAYIAQETSSQTQNVAAAAQQQTASMEEIRHSVTSLSKMSHELDTLVERFNLVKH